MVTESDLAAFWEVTTRQIRMLLSERVIVKSGDKLYDRSLATKSYIRHLIETAKIRGGTDPALKAERLRLTKAQSAKIEIQNAAKRGELIPISEVINGWSQTLRDVRAAMLAVPSRISERLPDLSPPEIEKIDAEIRSVLTEIADASH